MPLVTIIIPTLNAEKWIEEAIKSVQNQTFNDLQILIIDGGSADKTVEKVYSFNDPRIELYIKNHFNFPSSINYAITKSKGDFFARIDADDYCHKERIFKQIKFFNEHWTYGIVGCNFFLVNESGRLIDKIRNPQKHVHIVEQLPQRCCIFEGSILIRREIMKKLNGYNEKLIAGSDWDFFLRAIGITKFHNIQEYLSTKRFHSKSISSSEIAIEEAKNILLSYNKSIIKSSLDRNEKAKAYFNIGYYYYYGDNFKNANIYFNKACRKGGINPQLIRYFLLSKYLNKLIKFFRKYKLYKIFNWMRYFDNSNKYLRNKL